MKKIFAIMLVVIMSLGVKASAIEITKVDKVMPADEMFMDMAVTAAKKSIASKTGAAGAVIILNGAWRATGTPEGDKTAEEVAFSKSRLSKLNNATVYTINEPTTAVINFLNSLGVDAIYFANPRQVVIEAGIYPASAYDDSALDTSVKQAPVYWLPFDEAADLIAK